jgi:hypothetical protein
LVSQGAPRIGAARITNGGYRALLLEPALSLALP